MSGRHRAVKRVGERIPRNQISSFEPPSLEEAAVFSLSSSGGEGWGEEALSNISRGRFVGRVLISHSF
jgi:hypothetical protein